jgi:PAS domain-containing protein
MPDIGTPVIARNRVFMNIDAAEVQALAVDSPEKMNADRLAERMNTDSGKLGFLRQESEGSDLSGASTTLSLQELSSPEFFSRQCTDIDAMTERVVDESVVKEALRAVVADVQFCVTIADPKKDDVPLIAASEKFENITGFSRAEVLGKNCRFLQEGCVLDVQDLFCIRSAIETGAPFTAVLTNRRKSGELFLNLLDLRGLTVARNPRTGEELWFLVGIQADVTNLASEGEGTSQKLEEHIGEMQELASSIRVKLADELSAMAVAGALHADFDVVTPSREETESMPPDGWCLLSSAHWRNQELQLPWCVRPTLPEGSYLIL